jgi:Rrf2 family protein
MLFTKASEYALLSLVMIAEDDKPKNVDYLSTKLDISKSFLAKILQSLAKKDILVSFKGANGGFSLAKDISEISVYDIIIAVEDKCPSVFECSSIGACPKGQTGCNILPFLHRLQGKIDVFLKELTIADITN